MQELTVRQRQVLDTIEELTRTKGIPPTLREIGAHLGIRSTNGVNDHLIRLQTKGYLQKRPTGEGGDLAAARSLILTTEAWELYPQKLDERRERAEVLVGYLAAELARDRGIATEEVLTEANAAIQDICGADVF